MYLHTILTDDKVYMCEVLISLCDGTVVSTQVIVIYHQAHVSLSVVKRPVQTWLPAWTCLHITA